MGKKWMTAAATAAAAVAIAGCGGSSGDSDDASARTSTFADAISTIEFSEKVDAICTRPTRALSRLKLDISTVDGARAFNAKRRAAQARALDELSTLEPPSQWETHFADLQSVMERRSITLVPMQVLMLRRDPELARYFTEFGEQEAPLTELTTELSARNCNWQ